MGKSLGRYKTFGMTCGMMIMLAAYVAHGSDKFTVQVIETSSQIYTGKYGMSRDATAKVVLPNGDHASLQCGGQDFHCAKIESLLPPEKRKDTDTTCGSVGDVYICITKNLGEYTATRKGNVMTIEAPNGKLKFRVVGSW